MKQNVILFLFFALFILILYGSTRNAGFVTDFIGWQWSFNTQSFSEIISGESHNIKSYYHFTHLLMYGISTIFGTSGWAWFSIFLILFALDAILFYTLFVRLANRWQFEKGKMVGLVATMFFLASPYQSEVMVWRAAFHYLLCFAMQFSIFHLVVNYLEKPQKNYVIGALSLYICSIFSLEYFLFTPFLALGLIILWHFPFSQKTIGTYKKEISIFFLLPIGLIAAYFLSFKLQYGHTISHYGDDSVKKLFIAESYATYLKYIVKHIALLRYFPARIQNPVYAFIDNIWVGRAVILLVLALLLYGISRFSRFKPSAKVFYFSFVGFSLYLVPVITLFFANILLTENDRYGFFPSAFMFLALACLFSLFHKVLFYGFSIAYLSISLFFTYKTNRLWHDSSKVYWGLIEDFRWQNADSVVILNLPDCLEGMYMFRSWDNSSAFGEVYDAFKKTNISPKITEVLCYNMVTRGDGVKVKIEARDSLLVLFNQYGNWWIKRNWGAENYETPQYKVELGEGAYRLILKDTTKPCVFLYQHGEKWEEVRF